MMGLLEMKEVRRVNASKIENRTDSVHTVRPIKGLQAETPIWASPGAALPGLKMAGQIHNEE